MLSLLVFERIARRQLNIPKQKGWNNQYVNDTHKWGNRIIISSYIVVIAISTFLPNRIYMEWKYDKESREFLISLLGVVALIITGFILYFFL